MPAPRRVSARSPHNLMYGSPSATTKKRTENTTRTPTSALRMPRYTPPSSTKAAVGRSRSTERVFSFNRSGSIPTRGIGGEGEGMPRRLARNSSHSRPAALNVETSFSATRGLSRRPRPTTPLGLKSSRSGPVPAPKIYKSPQHFPPRDYGAAEANENYQCNHITQQPQHPAQARQLQAETRGRPRRRPALPLQSRKSRARSSFGRFSLSPSRRRAPKQNLNFSHEVETYLYEQGSEYESCNSTDNEGRTQLTRMLGGDRRLSQKVKAHIERKVDEEAAERFEKLALQEQLKSRQQTRAAAAAKRNSSSVKTKSRNSSRKKLKKKRKKGKSRSRSYSSDEETEASLGEMLEEACTSTGKRAAKLNKYFGKTDSSGYSGDSDSTEEETEYTMGTMTILEKADMLAKEKKKNRSKSMKKSEMGMKSSSSKSSRRKHHKLPEGCRYVKCPPGRLGISIDTTAEGPAIGYIAPKSPLIGLIDAGEVIVKIDKEDVTHLDAEDVMDMLLERKDEYRKLTIQE